MVQILFLLSFSLNLASFSFALQCKDESGQNVDWFVAYKLPKDETIKKSGNGLEYVYTTSKMSQKEWTEGKYTIRDERSLLARSLAPLYGPSTSSSNFILYSDQPPIGETGTNKGHSKGVIHFDRNSGFWLIHSVPGYPNDPDSNAKYSYPDTGIPNGQTCLCLSFKPGTSLSNIIDALLYIRPHVYGFTLSSDAEKNYPQILKLITKKWVRQGTQKSQIQSLKGDNFRIFAKSPFNSLDIYSELIAPDLKSNLLVETWRKGQGHPLPSACNTSYYVQNVKEMRIEKGNSEQSWLYTEDHSKWAISADENKPFLCTGDLNRMLSQYKRGGGAVCFKDHRLWSLMYNSIKTIEWCERTPKLAQKKASNGKSFLGRAIETVKKIFNS